MAQEKKKAKVVPVPRHGDLSSTIILRYHPFRSPSLNEVQTCTSDPNVEAKRQHAGLFTGGKAGVGNLTPALTVWFRVRTVGLKGAMGAWSDPAPTRWPVPARHDGGEIPANSPSPRTTRRRAASPARERR